MSLVAALAQALSPAAFPDPPCPLQPADPTVSDLGLQPFIVFSPVGAPALGGAAAERSRCLLAAGGRPLWSDRPPPPPVVPLWSTGGRPRALSTVAYT